MKFLFVAVLLIAAVSANVDDVRKSGEECLIGAYELAGQTNYPAYQEDMIECVCEKNRNLLAGIEGFSGVCDTDNPKLATRMAQIGDWLSAHRTAIEAHQETIAKEKKKAGWERFNNERAEHLSKKFGGEGLTGDADFVHKTRESANCEKYYAEGRELLKQFQEREDLLKQLEKYADLDEKWLKLEETTVVESNDECRLDTLEQEKAEEDGLGPDSADKDVIGAPVVPEGDAPLEEDIDRKQEQTEVPEMDYESCTYPDGSFLNCYQIEEEGECLKETTNSGVKCCTWHAGEGNPCRDNAERNEQKLAEDYADRVSDQLRGSM